MSAIDGAVVAILALFAGGAVRERHWVMAAVFAACCAYMLFR